MGRDCVISQLSSTPSVIWQVPHKYLSKESIKWNRRIGWTLNLNFRYSGVSFLLLHNKLVLNKLCETTDPHYLQVFVGQNSRSPLFRDCPGRIKVWVSPEAPGPLPSSLGVGRIRFLCLQSRGLCAHEISWQVHSIGPWRLTVGPLPEVQLMCLLPSRRVGTSLTDFLMVPSLLWWKHGCCDIVAGRTILSGFAKRHELSQGAPLMSNQVHRFSPH